MNITDAGNTLVFSETTPEEKKRILEVAKEPTPARPKMLSRKEVAKMLGVSGETIKRYGRKGLLHPVKFTARAVRYSEAEVLDFMQKGVAV